jgi:hypothetical protein
MFIYHGIGGRVGNCIFRYLATRLLKLLYNAEITPNTIEPYIIFDDNNFNIWLEYLTNTSKLIPIDKNLYMEGFYQYDMIYRTFKNELIQYIIENPDENIETYDTFKFKPTEIIGKNPVIDISFNTVVHLRVEDFLGANMGMNPLCIDYVLNKCEEPFLFVHKPVENDVDKKYIGYFKEKYPTANFYTEDVLKCYNLMRHAKVLVCSRSTLSWVAALFNEVNENVYMPINYGTIPHEKFQYPNDNTELYEWKTISKEDILQL